MKRFILIMSLIITFFVNAQEKKDFHFLIESGLESTGKKNYFHFGAGTEYFFTKKSSLLLRIKYHNSNINQKHESNGGFFSTRSYNIVFNSTLLTIPLNYKYESSLFSKNISIFTYIGPALNFTLDEQYLVTENIDKQDNKTYININLGLGFSYKLDDSSSIFFATEGFSFGGGKTDKKGFIFSSRIFPTSILFNVGYKFKI